MFLLKNIISKEECNFLTKVFYSEKLFEKNYDINSYSSPNSFGFRPSHNFNQYMDKLKPIIQKYSNNKIVNVNTYVREYKNNCELVKHTDRDDIGITLSICLYNDTNVNWELIADIDNKEYAYNANIGDGILLLNSNKVTHWRNPLICDYDKKYIAFFLHWIEIDENIKQKNTLI